jgi:isopentenyl-diphosphate delta-isomerase
MFFKGIGQMPEQLILVDEKDNQIGVMEKMQTHREGRLHRAVSAIVINSKNQMLIQQRALTKYHSPGLWANACCTHPRPGESVESAVSRRLQEELGISCLL